MKIRLWSDIHTEFGGFVWERRPDDKETTLIIAGDFQVGDRSFDTLHELCDTFKYVLYTCGNHEYYGQDMRQVDSWLCAFESDSKNFYYMNPGDVILDGVRFIGATLWTDLNKGDPIIVDQVKRAMNDFRQIRVGEALFTPEIQMRINAADVKYIRDVLSQPFDGKTVIFTHHAPLMQCVGNDPRYRDYRSRILNYGYGNTGLDDLFEDGNFHYWFHGHIHMWQEFEVNGKKIMARPRGYHRYEICAKVYDDQHKDAEIIEV